MRNSGLPFLFFLSLISVAIALACGVSTPRMLESVSLSPTTADAQNFPNGEVPFVATGYYTRPPSTVTPETATWGACSQNGATSAVSVSTTGVARCTAGASGIYMVWAGVPNPAFTGTCPAFLTACGLSCNTVVGTATLTCP
jgi:hypothetical protein